MFILHAIWNSDRLHLFGQAATDVRNGSACVSMAPPRQDGSPRDIEPGRQAGDTLPSDPAGASQSWASFDEINFLIGDAWSSFAALEATPDTLTLFVPAGPTVTGDAEGDQTAAGEVKPVIVPTLSLAVVDAMDLLCTPPRSVPSSFSLGDTFEYWTRAATFVLDLLARQRFVPAVIRTAGGLHGLWRAVPDDDESARRAASLVACMPRACRATSDPPADTSAELDGFLWRAVDSLVRACMDRDELTHALRSLPPSQRTTATRWLQSLVSDDTRIEAAPEELARIQDQVSGWLARLGPTAPVRAFRTEFRLEPPQTPIDESSAGDGHDSWRLTIHVRSSSDPARVIDARDLDAGGFESHPVVLPRPFEGAKRELRKDLARAARHFAPLEPCASDDGPLALDLTLSEAYTFLRDAAPLLKKSEEFEIHLPDWWRRGGRRLRMRIDLSPTEFETDSASARVGLDAIVSFDWQVALGDEPLSRDELAELAAAQSPLAQIRGQWTEIQPSEIRQAVDFVTRHRAGRMTLFEALRQCYLADDMDTGLPVVGVSAHGWIERLLSNAEVERQYDAVEQPTTFHGTLRPYQLRGIGWLAFLSRIGLGACLADDMGLGKTIQLIGLLLDERRDDTPPPGPTLLVVPTSLVGNWQREIERFAPRLRAMVHHGTTRSTGQAFLEEVRRHDVVICTYALTHRDFEHLSAAPWHRIALDEAQNIKNSASKQAAAIRALRCVHRVAMTGTPVENRLSELWSILDFLNPGFLGPATEFRRRFAVPIERHHDDDRAERLRQLIRPFILRRLKSDPNVIADLPEKMEMKVYCHLTREQAALYEAVVGDMLGQIDRSSGMQRRGLILATLIKLKQLCNHPAHYHGDASALPGRSGKCERLVEMVDELLAEGDRALIFTQFRRMGDLLKRLIEDSFSQSVFFLHGGTPRVQRDQMIERFQDPSERTRLFILSLRAGGFGLNLTAANHVFHFDRWWNPAVEDQATDRVHRVGQTRNVQVHKFICIGTLEERIDGMLEQKRSLAQNILGSGEDWLTELSTEQLRSLFALSREAVSED